MPEKNPPTRTMQISDVKKTLSSLVNEIYETKTRVLAAKSGIPIAALVSIDDSERLQEFERAWDEGTKAIERFSQTFSGVPTEEAEAEVARIFAEVRQRRAAEAERQTA